MSDFKNSKVFVSGGAGVIGNVLVERLIQQGANVLVGDLKPIPSAWKNVVTYREGDLNTVSKQELLDFQPEYYFHLAATFERSEETYEFWEENYHHNIRLSHHLIDCLKDSASLKRVVFASSYLIYDPGRYLFSRPRREPVVLSEGGAVRPRNLCGMAKLLHEQELFFIRSFNQPRLSTVSARIFRSYGRNSKDVISRWIRTILRDEEIQVYNTEGIFDYIFADDVAEGLLRLAAVDESGEVNLGSGQGRKVAEIVGELEKHFPQMKIAEKESSGPYEASEAHMGTFEAWTGWKPKHQLEDAIPLIIQYERERI